MNILDRPLPNGATLRALNTVFIGNVYSDRTARRAPNTLEFTWEDFAVSARRGEDAFLRRLIGHVRLQMEGSPHVFHDEIGTRGFCIMPGQIEFARGLLREAQASLVAA